MGLFFVAALFIPIIGSRFYTSVATDILILGLFATSLNLLLGTTGLVSFGHAAYFAIGAYSCAIAMKTYAVPFALAFPLAGITAAFAALVFGFFCVRLTKIYFAMLTLAFAQIAWSIAFQWTDVTGGDNGILGVWAPAWAAGPSTFYGIVLAIVVLGVGALRTIALSPFGYALRGVRDSDLRAEAIGISRRNVQWAAFVTAGGFAALAGALFVFLKGSVFPDSLGIPLSVDALVMVLLGGVGTVSGAVVGAIVYRALTILLMSQTDYSKLVLGLIVVTLVVAFPAGIVGSIERLRERVRLGAAAAGIAKLAAAE
jgi:branched-chain amino acid transport system permease protein